MTNKSVSIRLALQGGPEVERQFKRLGDEGHRALSRVQAGSTPASRGLLALNAVTSQLRGNMTGMAGSLGVVGSGLIALGPAGLAAGAAVAALALTLKSVLGSARNAITELDKLGDTAEKLGVSAEGLQELRYAFGQTGVSSETLDMGLQRLGRRMGEIANFGKGEAKNTFDELGISIYDTAGKLKTIEDVLPEIADALSKVSDQNRRLSLTQKLVDSESVAMVNLFAQGSGALARYREDARSLGVVVDEAFVQKAGAAADKLDALHNVIDAKLNTALVDLVPVLIAMAEGFAYTAAAVADLVDSFRDLEDMSAGGLRKELSGLSDEMEGLSADLDKLYSQWEAKKEALSKPGGVYKGILGIQVQNLQSDIDAKLAEIQAVKTQMDGVQTQLAERTKRPAVTPNLGTGLTGASAAPVKDPINEYIGTLNKKVSAQETEINVLGRSAGAQARARAELEINNIVAEKGITLTTSQSAALQVSLGHLESATDRFAELGEAQSVAAARAQAFGDAFTSSAQDVIFNSKSAGEAVRNLGMEIAKMAITQAFIAPAGKAAGSFLSNILPFHDGGVIGGPSTAMPRLSNLASWQGAQKLHSGGFAANEVPIIALRGERMLTEAQQDNTASTLASLATMVRQGSNRPSGSNVQVHVHNNASHAQGRVQETQGPNGEVRIDVFVEKIENHMARNIRKGDGLAGTFETRYGLNPVGGSMS